MKYQFKLFTSLSMIGSIFYPLVSVAIIPPSHIKGVDELFKPEFKIYSPLTGLMSYQTFIYNNFDSTEEAPLKALLSQLFVRIPGGEITSSHMNKNPGAHLSSKVIGSILGEFEALRNSGLPSEEFRTRLGERVRSLILEDERYQGEMRIAQDKVSEARQKEESLVEQFKQENIAVAEVDQFKESEIVPLDRKIKKLRVKFAKMARDTSEFNSASEELNQLELNRFNLTEQYQKMRSGFLTRAQQKEAKRKVEYTITTNDVATDAYRLEMDALIASLVECFDRYDLKLTESRDLHFSTTTTLLSYLWMKFLTKQDLLEYMGALSDKASVLESHRWVNLEPSFVDDIYSDTEYGNLKKSFLKSWRKEKWTREHLAGSVALSMDLPSNSSMPSVVSFSFLRWVAYSYFPDCCENAIHNILNLMAFNPATGEYDFKVLQKLKERFFPGLMESVIEFYKKFPSSENQQSNAAAAAWIEVVSGLNDHFENLSETDTIHYRGQRSHIASPYSNIVKVVNRLFGFEHVSADRMSEIFSKVGPISKFVVNYSNDEIDDEGFGSAKFQVSQGVFQLDAYRPVHLSFFLKKVDSDGFLDKLSRIFLRKATRKTSSDEVKTFRYRSGVQLIKVLKEPRACCGRSSDS